MAEFADRDPEDLPDEATVEAAVSRRYGYAAVAWAIGALLVAVDSLVDAVVGSAIADLAPGDLILHGATAASFAGGALVLLAAMRLWRYRIRSAESRLDRYRWGRRYRAARLGLVVLFAFLVGMVFWYIRFQVVALVAVTIGFPVLLAVAHRRWDRLDDRGQELIVLGAGLIGLHPISMILLDTLGPFATAGGYGLLAAGLIRPVLELAEEEGEDLDETEAARADQSEPDPAEPSR